MEENISKNICYGCGKSDAETEIEIFDFCPHCCGGGCLGCNNKGETWQLVHVHNNCLPPFNNYVCKVCGESFEDNDSLYEHYDESHNKENI